MSAKGSDGAFDPGLYLEPPVLDTPGMLALGRAIMYLAPTPPPPDLLMPLRRLKQAWDELQNSTNKPKESGRHESRQPSDVIMDNSWTALYERLRAYALLPESEVPRVRRAHDLLRLLFPDGIGFLKLPYEQEWSESGNRLRLIDRLRLSDELDALAGPEFLVQVRRAHDLYGRTLGVSGDAIPEPASEGAHVRELRMALGRSISHYALKVLSLADDDLPQVRRLLAPLAEHQRSMERRPSFSRQTQPIHESKAITPSDRPPISRTDSGVFRVATESNAPKPLHTGDSGAYRIGADGTVRPIGDSGANRTDSGIFRVPKKPG